MSATASTGTTEQDELIQRAAMLARRAKHAVALTGAGVSTASGLPDFRSPGKGLWAHVDPMEVASLQAFRAHPEKFYEWIRPLAEALRAARPNGAHAALARLEAMGLLAHVITQNIDMLHERAGSRRVIEIHGQLREATCISCYRARPAAGLLEDWLDGGGMPTCSACGGAMKPNVILLGEQLPAQALANAKKTARECDLMFVVGCSLEVLPAAELPQLALDRGAPIIVINREPTYVDRRAAVVIRADAADALPQLVDEVTHAVV